MTGSIGAIDPFHNDELERFRTMPLREIGVLAALDYCGRHKIPQPQWMASAAFNVLAESLLGRRQKGLGRFSGAVNEHRRLHIHFIRHDTICEVREKQVELAATIAELRTLRKVPPTLLNEKQKLLDWAGHSLERAYECASMILQNTHASGKPASMQSSYFKWQEISRDPEQVKHYRLLNAGLLRVLGIDDGARPRQVRQIVPLHDLTL